MGGGGRRHQGCRHAEGLARRRCWPTAAVIATRCSSHMRIVRSGDDKALRAVAELAAAFAPSKERHLETTAQGNAFVEATRAAWPCAALDRLKAVWDGPVAYPVAVAVAGSRSRHCARAGACRLSASRRRQLGLRRRAADPARPDRRPARAGGARADRRGHRATRARRRARRHRLVGLPRRPRQRAARDAVHKVVQELTMRNPQRPLARRRRRPGRLRQDRADGRAVQEAARPLRDRRHHQRHLHQMGRRISGALGRARRPTASPASRPAAARTPRSARMPRSISPRSPRCGRNFPISIWC